MVVERLECVTAPLCRIRSGLSTSARPATPRRGRGCRRTRQSGRPPTSHAPGPGAGDPGRLGSGAPSGPKAVFSVNASAVGPVAPEPFERGHRLGDGRPVSLRHPPHRERRPRRRQEPLPAPAEEGDVLRAIGIAAQVLQRTPGGEVEQDARVFEDANAGGVAARGPEAPEAARRSVADDVHPVDGLHELHHARIVERMACPGEIRLCEIHGAILPDRWRPRTQGR